MSEEEKTEDKKIADLEIEIELNFLYRIARVMRSEHIQVGNELLFLTKAYRAFKQGRAMSNGW